MKSGRILTLAIVASLAATAGDAWGQIFGARTLGQGIAQPQALRAQTPITGQTATTTQTATRATGGGMPTIPGYGNIPGTANNPNLAARLRGRSLPNSTGSAGSGSIMDNGRFLRDNRAPGSFVGADSHDLDHLVGAGDADPATAIRSAIDAVRTRLTTNSAAGGGVAGAAGTGRRLSLYPPQLTVGFDYSLPPAPDRGATLKQQLESCSRLQRQGPLEVSLAGQTATLRGTVASERDRQLAQMLVLFEPGVANVKNELRVATPPPTAPPPPGSR